MGKRQRIELPPVARIGGTGDNRPGDSYDNEEDDAPQHGTALG
jgi:hypothetical protein